MDRLHKTAEWKRLKRSEDRKADWKNWGPYVSDRAWGTVREHYAHDKSVWSSFPFDHAHKRVFRWNEDGIAGFCNRFQNVCQSIAFWNGKDPILKERLFGLSGEEGNHGEDVKEYYFYLDGLPTHAYMKMQYNYPQVEFPYEQLRSENRTRSRYDLEYELADAIPEDLASGRYFTITIEIAKAEEDDIVYRITATNNAEDPAPLWIIPQLFFRNRWSWGSGSTKPVLNLDSRNAVELVDDHLGRMHWHLQFDGDFEILFTDNESSAEFAQAGNASGFSKDAFNNYIISGDKNAVNPDHRGTKCAGVCSITVPAKATATVYTRLSPAVLSEPFSKVDELFELRIAECNEFYSALQSPTITAEQAMVQRQAYAGLLWSKQFYHFSVQLWSDGDEDGHPPGLFPRRSYNADWRHLYNLDVISMPDKWEYPWYAAWDLAFHMIPMASLDPEWARRQLILMLREWFIHPNGQLPAYEWSFSDVNPPVHAWSALRVYQILQSVHGIKDTKFLERIFHKLLQNFTWWVNRKDRDGNNVFEGGFLGLDNIGIFDRSKPLPTGGYIEQADGTAWMAMYCLNMLEIALELAVHNNAYEDVATKFFEHFIYISAAINNPDSHASLWDDQDGFYYDSLHLPDEARIRLKIQSLVGLIPMIATAVLKKSVLDKLPRFKRRMDWFLKYRPRLIENASVVSNSRGDEILLSLVNSNRLERILERLFDTEQFLSPFGIRSLSKRHESEPYQLHINSSTYSIDYQPAESRDYLFGGNSNWRGPIWFPINYLLIEALHTFDDFFEETRATTIEGKSVSLSEAARDISRRLQSIFMQGADGARPVFGGAELFRSLSDWNDCLLFYEYFHGDNGAGIGASHQTGWTALVATLIQNDGRLS